MDRNRLLQIGDFYVYQLNREGHAPRFLIGHLECPPTHHCATTLDMDGPEWVRRCLGCGATSTPEESTVLTDALELIKLGLRNDR